MKWLFIALCCILFSSAFGQKHFRIYDAKGRLIADSSYSISKQQLLFFSKIEDTLIQQILHDSIEYPEEARDANIKGTILASFEICDSNKFCNFLLLNEASPNYSINYHYFFPIVTAALLKVDLSAYKIPKYILYKKYYLAFEFHLSPADENKTSFSQGIFIVRRKLNTVTIIDIEGPIAADSTSDTTDSAEH